MNLEMISRVICIYNKGWNASTQIERRKLQNECLKEESETLKRAKKYNDILIERMKENGRYITPIRKIEKFNEDMEKAKIKAKSLRDMIKRENANKSSSHEKISALVHKYFHSKTNSMIKNVISI